MQKIRRGRGDRMQDSPHQLAVKPISSCTLAALQQKVHLPSSPYSSYSPYSPMARSSQGQSRPAAAAGGGGGPSTSNASTSGAGGGTSQQMVQRKQLTAKSAKVQGVAAVDANAVKRPGGAGQARLSTASNVSGRVMNIFRCQTAQRLTWFL